MSGMEIEDVLRALPERYPLLLVDRILELEPGVRAVGLKNVTINEEFFRGHFPDHPVMPGVLVLEAMAQVGRVVLGAEGMRLTAIEKARFRRPITPGDAVRVEVHAEESGAGGWTLRGRAHVGDALAAEAILHAAVEDP